VLEGGQRELIKVCGDPYLRWRLSLKNNQGR
jgi:hypothetical protein